jgi:anti-sigma28 factor (negative regulator of flagellin synthesis)
VEQVHALNHARAVAQAAPEVRQAQVEAARRALQEGTLTLDGPALAEKLLQAVRTERRHL